MLVSLAYIRLLILLSFLAAEILLWIANARQLFYPTLGLPFCFLVSVALGFPLAFLILTVLVRTVPRVAEPTLILRDPDSVTTLDLSGNDDAHG